MSLGPVSSSTANMRGNTGMGQTMEPKRMSIAPVGNPSMNTIGGMNAAASRRMSMGATALPPPVRRESIAVGAAR
jgi:hypothetical protein